MAFEPALPPFGTSNVTKRANSPTFCELGVIYKVRKIASNDCRLEFDDGLWILRPRANFPKGTQKVLLLSTRDPVHLYSV